MIINDITRVTRMTIISDATIWSIQYGHQLLELLITLLENIYSTDITHDGGNNIVQATGYSIMFPVLEDKLESKRRFLPRKWISKSDLRWGSIGEPVYGCRKLNSKLQRAKKHRDKTRVQMPNVSSFEINMLAVYGPRSWF
jgi:hypothetical protein